MAVCEIWDVKGRLDHPIDYAKNPEKTVNPKYTEADFVLVKLFGNTLFGNHALYRNSIGVI